MLYSDNLVLPFIITISFHDIFWPSETIKVKNGGNNPKKMINGMQFIGKPRPLSPSILSLQQTKQSSEQVDPKEEAVLKKVREFLYQNMVGSSNLI